MLLIGTAYAWETVQIEKDAEPFRVLLKSTEAAEIEAMEAALAEPEPGPMPEDKESPDYHDRFMAWAVIADARHTAWTTGIAKLTIQQWRGVGAAKPDGSIAEVPVTPENIELLMRDARVHHPFLDAVKRVNARIVSETVAAGNA